MEGRMGPTMTIVVELELGGTSFRFGGSIRGKTAMLHKYRVCF